MLRASMMLGRGILTRSVHWPAGPPARQSRNLTSKAATLYDDPALYQSVFSYRDIPKEASFLLKTAYAKHAQQSNSEGVSVLDLGSGPGDHAIALALEGAKVVGLDLNEQMLKFAGSNAQSKGASDKVSFVQGNMCSFEGLGQFDMITCLLGTFSHVLTNAQALDAFSSVSKSLRPGGIFVLELAHPGDLFDGSLILDDGGGEMWEALYQPKGAKGANRLLVQWGDANDDFNPETQIIERSVTISEFKGEKGEEVVRSIEDQQHARQYTTQEIDLLGRASGLEVVKLFGDMESEVGLTHEEAFRLVAVLRKKS